jgi:hypothetical protein
MNTQTQTLFFALSLALPLSLPGLSSPGLTWADDAPGAPKAPAAKEAQKETGKNVVGNGAATFQLANGQIVSLTSAGLSIVVPVTPLGVKKIFYRQL